MIWLWILAIVAQTADTALTCQRFRQGAREINPWLPHSCVGIASIKGSILGLTPFLPKDDQRYVLTVLAVGGGVGVTLSIALKE